ncbi:TetR/AcrR family transcriptional regulator [Stackebrandtia soli]|uniref:TetR/AcrR family transcriptional regulator n=1 Tax=Stackebrandtia soli TaxID=1892856 RepID=UPI0039E9C978
MPRHVDADERRQHVARAVWRVVLRDGFGAASVRAVATEAGLSAGSLRHYFGTQEELREYALALADARMTARMTRVDRTGTVREVVERLLWASLPMDEESIELYRIWYSFLVESRGRLRELVTDASREALDLTREALDALREGGEIAASVDVDTATTELNALLEGLSLQAVVFGDHVTPDLIRATVRAWLDRLRPPG